MSELRQCPFCGGKPILDREAISCFDCGVIMPIDIYVSGGERIGGFPSYEEARQEMIEDWNRRVHNSNDFTPQKDDFSKEGG